MKVHAGDFVKCGTKEVNGKTLPLYRMSLYANGDYETAKTTCVDQDGNLSFHDGCFNDLAIAQGTAYLNTQDGSVRFYDEENDEFGE